MKGLIATLSLLLSLSLPFGETVCAQGDQYRFVMVSHIGSNDPNMNWLTTSMKTFGERYPEVKTEYLSPNEYSLQSFITILNQAIATRPDGIAVPMRIAVTQARRPVRVTLAYEAIDVNPVLADQFFPSPLAGPAKSGGC